MTTSTPAEPCGAHQEPRQDCLDCQDRAERRAKIDGTLGELASSAQAGLCAVADGERLLTGLRILYDAPLIDSGDAGDLAAELETAGRAWRNVRRIIAGRTAGAASAMPAEAGGRQAGR